MSTPTTTDIRQVLEQSGYEDFAMIPLGEPMSVEHYHKWLERDQQGEMAYMQDSKEARSNPRKNFPEMRSLIVFREAYFPIGPSASPQDDFPFPGLKVAHYAQQPDYHGWLRAKLTEAIKQLQERFPEAKFLAFTDAVPLLERDYAAQAGLAWTGKNTCSIHPKAGSLFFVGEILTSLGLNENPETIPDFCGSCTACLDACPTDAFIEPRVLDANRCISHWNIESKKLPPKEIRQAIGDWFFGCDICQTVCPWNIKLHKSQSGFVQKTEAPELAVADLKRILTSSNKQLLRDLKDSPLSRAGGRGLKRNALLVIGNRKLTALHDIVASFTEDESLGELAHWTLEQLNST